MLIDWNSDWASGVSQVLHPAKASFFQSSLLNAFKRLAERQEASPSHPRAQGLAHRPFGVVGGA